jgi:RNA polymerase sigma-70 factor, ECF subfamily
MKTETISNVETQSLLLARQGNAEAFSFLVETYQKPVYNLCFRMLGNVLDAEDASQETFWRAFQNIHRYDMNRSFITWLLSIAAHYCIDQQRKRRLPSIELDSLPDEDVPDQAPEPEKIFHTMEEQKLLHQIISKLEAQDRATVILRYWYDLSDQEIGQALSLSVSAVKSRLFRARKYLAQAWLSASPKPVKTERKPYESPAI